MTVAYRYDYMGNQTVAETLGGTAADLTTQAAYDMVG